jgi:hypothetical protein
MDLAFLESLSEEERDWWAEELAYMQSLEDGTWDMAMDQVEYERGLIERGL